ncbi:Aspercryptin biosynthesis cluster-specific transcription regulator atnN [Fusarium oxysporum f. sp. cubense]|uniref:Aspercryptin biosynthesis cluster-specific transcription regulator atnN n=1 Tax=Fusarium oxysporum f. sp. cubense TaxID=61366 RepID=A0A559LQW7_FUSOC|nr:Aspercryptin biosynthesis cluster-specific transcription regulator atnN [Fusarium oxysporum f. sp. cubense]
MAGKPVRKRWLMKCRIRRVKCDEARPACTRCTSTGRKCDGYQTEAPSPPAKSSPSVISSPTSVVSTYTTRPEARSFQFFIEKTLVNFQTFFDDDLWNRRVLQVAQSTDCIRHAIVALAYYHQLYLTHEQWRSLESVSALKHYNLAIRELLNPSPDTSSQGHILVLSCLIFICIELLHGKTDSAISLFRYGCRMIQQFRRTFSANRGHGSHTKSDVEATFNLADACFRRIAVQLLMLMGDVDAGLRSSYYETFSNTLPPHKISFSSLSDAREAILELLVEQASPGLKGKPIYETISHASKVEQWGQSFDNLLTELGNSGKSFSAGDKRAIALLQLHRKYLEINVAKYLHGQGDPCFWDRFTTEFDEIVNYAARAAGLDKNYTQRNWANDSPSEAYFHVDIGYTSVLVSVIARCRDPSVRRRAIAVMLAERVQEGVEPVEEDQQQTLRDSFSRAAYVVFALENKNVHIAQAANCTSDIGSTGAGSDSVPSVTGNCRALSLVQENFLLRLIVFRMGF